MEEYCLPLSSSFIPTIFLVYRRFTYNEFVFKTCNKIQQLFLQSYFSNNQQDVYGSQDESFRLDLGYIDLYDR